jgi:hypothetical protein
MASVPMTYTPQDFSGGSLLATSSATACSRFSTRARTKNSAIAALSPGTHLAVEKRDKNGARETQRFNLRHKTNYLVSRFEIEEA